MRLSHAGWDSRWDRFLDRLIASNVAARWTELEQAGTRCAPINLKSSRPLLAALERERAARDRAASQVLLRFVTANRAPGSPRPATSALLRESGEPVVDDHQLHLDEAASLVPRSALSIADAGPYAARNRPGGCVRSPPMDPDGRLT